MTNKFVTHADVLSNYWKQCVENGEIDMTEEDLEHFQDKYLPILKPLEV